MNQFRRLHIADVLKPLSQVESPHYRHTSNLPFANQVDDAMRLAACGGDHDLFVERECDRIDALFEPLRKIPKLPRVTTAVRQLDPEIWGDLDGIDPVGPVVGRSPAPSASGRADVPSGSGHSSVSRAKPLIPNAEERP